MDLLTEETMTIPTVHQTLIPTALPTEEMTMTPMVLPTEETTTLMVHLIIKLFNSSFCLKLFPKCIKNSNGCKMKII